MSIVVLPFKPSNALVEIDQRSDVLYSLGSFLPKIVVKIVDEFNNVVCYCGNIMINIKSPQMSVTCEGLENPIFSVMPIYIELFVIYFPLRLMKAITALLNLKING